MLRAAPSSPTEAVRDQIVIAPHHQDSLRRPSPRLGAIGHDRFRQTLLWNVFRTFELLPPAFWLRRLQARLHMDPSPERLTRFALTCGERWACRPLTTSMGLDLTSLPTS